MDFNEMAAVKLQEIIDNKLEGLLEKHLEKAIEDAVSNALRWGDSEKALKETIQQAIGLGLNSVKIEDYQTRITAVIEDQLGKYLDERAQQIISGRILEICKAPEKKQWKFSELLEMFVQEYFQWHDEESEFIPTIIIEKSNYNTIYISLDNDKNKKTYDCTHSISLDKDGTISNYKTRDYTNKEIKVKYLRSKFEALLFSLYANECTIEIDEHETEFYKEQDYQ